MIVCVCSNVSEKQINELLPASLEDVMMKTSAGMCCGQCFEYLQEIVEKQQKISATEMTWVISHSTSPGQT